MLRQVATDRNQLQQRYPNSAALKALDGLLRSRRLLASGDDDES